MIQLDRSLLHGIHGTLGSQQVQQHQPHVHQRLTNHTAGTRTVHHIHHHLHTTPKDWQHRVFHMNAAAVLIEMVAEFEQNRSDWWIVLLPCLQQGWVVAGVLHGGAGDVVKMVKEGAPLIRIVSIHDVCEGLQQWQKALDQELFLQSPVKTNKAAMMCVRAFNSDRKLWTMTVPPVSHYNK